MNATMDDIHGIGPSKKKELLAQGVRTFEDLMKPEVFDTLPKATKAYLTYSPIARIPRATIARIDEIMQTALKPLRPFLGGSYSRHKSHSGDIDLLILNTWPWDKVLNALHSLHPIEPFSIGDWKLSTLIKPGKKYMKIDIFRTTKEEYMFAKTYVIGSGQMNIRLRVGAKRNGYTLNQRGLFKGKRLTKVAVRNERELFALCGVTYVEPSER